MFVSKNSANFALKMIEAAKIIPSKDADGLRKFTHGAVLEWLKRHAWKACIRQKRIPSSNLGRSANITDKF